MSTTVTFGVGETCEVALGDYTLLAPVANGRALLEDPAVAMGAALAEPLQFPPMAAAVVPGDRVAIALGKDIPQLASVLRGAIAELVEAGIEPENVTVLSAEPFEAQAELAGRLGVDGVRFEVHNPDDEAAIAMVGMTAAHRPLRLNRTLADADFVLPIGLARPAASEGVPVKFGGLFPRFSNRETVDRFHGRDKSATPQRRIDRVAETNEAGWLLGVGLAAVVVPGPGGGVAAIVAGEPAAATQAAAQQFQAIWERPAEQPGDLVIAGVAGDATQQTWDNLARAVSACEKVKSPEGAIAVCCELEAPPAGSFEALVDAVDFAAVARGLRGGAAADARPAMILAQALERGPVYLRSRLPAEVVESLGMTPIESDAELSRLAAGRRHCVVIEEAQRLRPRLVSGQERS